MQWALGIMMYQMLSGHLPFWNAQSDRSPFAVMSAILSAEVRHLLPAFFGAVPPMPVRVVWYNECLLVVSPCLLQAGMSTVLASTHAAACLHMRSTKHGFVISLSTGALQHRRCAMMALSGRRSLMRQRTSSPSCWTGTTTHA